MNLALLVDILSMVGAWLLVAGPIFQAYIELTDADLQVFEVRKRLSKLNIEPPKPVSKWLWLFPPAHFLSTKRIKEDHRMQITMNMDDDTYDLFSSFLHKARGWFLVASGATLIAIKETFELVERLEWSKGIFFCLVIVCFIIAVGNTYYAGIKDRYLAQQRKQYMQKRN